MVDPVGVLVKLLAPDADVGAYNDWRFVATSTLAPGILVALGCLLAAASTFGLAGTAMIDRVLQLRGQDTARLPPAPPSRLGAEVRAG